MMNEALFRETLLIRLAFGDLVGRVCVPGTDASTVPLAEVRDGLDAWGLDRYAALLLANRLADTFEEGLALAVEVRADWLGQDRRPRTMQETVGPRVEAAFARAEQRPWYARLWERLRRALMADEEMSEELSRVDLELRDREGKVR